MKTIPVIQFIRPYGKQAHEFISVSNEASNKYDELHKAGLQITSEVLSTGQVSLCLSDNQEDYDIRICSNGPKVKQSIEDMLLRFDPIKYLAYKSQRELSRQSS